jgi:hypothetical protein
MQRRALGLNAVPFAFATFALTGCASDLDVTDDDSEAAQRSASSDTAAYCRAIREVSLSNVHLVSGWGEGDVGPNAILSVTINNEGDEASIRALTAYPGIRITFDPPVATVSGGQGPGEGIQALTGTLKPGVSQTVSLRITAKAGTPAGTRVAISAAMADNRWPYDHCASDGPATSGEATIGGPRAH